MTNEQARNFILLKQGLIGEYKFKGKQGVCDFIKQAGCIQFDPIDVCGKNADIVLNSRVSDFTKEILYQLLYEERKLVDYFDKNMAIFCIEDWKYFSHSREKYRLYGRSRDKVNMIADMIKRIIREKKFVNSRDIGLKETVDWGWNPTTLARAALETLYFRGDLIIHHKKGTMKYYALANDHIDPTVLHDDNPNKTVDDFVKWQVLRRIGSIGILWKKPSDAWIGIGDFKSDYRERIFSSLLAENKIIECTVEGISHKLYFLSEDESIMEIVFKETSLENRLEFIAPLDNMIWDRNLISAIFNFDYKWEIYIPVSKRKYGYYVLPVLFGNRFIGRIETIINKKLKQLHVLHFWKEKGFEPDKYLNRYLQDCLERFANLNLCENSSIQFVI
ncbi:MAG: winged helix DNA-binding domain-containing protein [Actinobacteria bacterium]|nr:winged helix DNA-binding domain-containing protein [Actinomycetota bacterium]